MLTGKQLAVGISKSVAIPAVVMRPILLTPAPGSANQSAPSCPAVILPGAPPGVDTENSVKTSAIACSATPTTAHSETIATSGNRRCLFCMGSPPDYDTRREGLRQMSYPSKDARAIKNLSRPTSAAHCSSEGGERRSNRRTNQVVCAQSNHRLHHRRKGRSGPNARLMLPCAPIRANVSLCFAGGITCTIDISIGACC
jgi:hypothetical protein